MAKKVVKEIKLQIPAGRATPAPPVGPALGSAGVPIPMFVKEFNARTQAQAADNLMIPVIVTAYSDRTFTFICKTPPAAGLILKALGAQKGSGEPNKAKVGTLTMSQVTEIARQKLEDMNTTDLEAATRSIAGSCRSMGVNVVEG